VKPSDGATLAMFDFRSSGATLINSIQRRPEAYHTRLRLAASSGPATGTVSIHDQVRVKEPNLERLLRYDRFPRHSFRLVLFDPERNFSDYELLRLAELPGPASGPFEIRNCSTNSGDFAFEQLLSEFAADSANPPRITISKHFFFGPAPRGCEISCDVRATLSAPLSRSLRVGIESVINFLAPAANDRFFETPSGRRNLRFAGALPAPFLRLEDGWQHIRATLHAPSSDEFWIAPIETVSESEDGFERMYQGSQMLALWSPDFVSRTSFSARLMWRLESF